MQFQNADNEWSIQELLPRDLVHEYYFLNPDVKFAWSTDANTRTKVAEAKASGHPVWSDQPQKDGVLEKFHGDFSGAYIKSTAASKSPVRWALTTELEAYVLADPLPEEKAFREFFQSHCFDFYLASTRHQRLTKVTGGVATMQVSPIDNQCELVDGRKRLRVAIQQGVKFFPIQILIEQFSSNARRKNFKVTLWRADGVTLHEASAADNAERKQAGRFLSSYFCLVHLRVSPLIGDQRRIDHMDVDESLGPAQDLYAALKRGYWLSTYDLQDMAKMLGMNTTTNFVGVFASDEIGLAVERSLRGTWTAIVNCDSSDKAGNHWVVARWTKTRLNTTGNILEPLYHKVLSAPLQLVFPNWSVQVLKWQNDGWTCGYHSLWAALLLDAPRSVPEKTPKAFLRYVWALLRKFRRYMGNDDDLIISPDDKAILLSQKNKEIQQLTGMITHTRVHIHIYYISARIMYYVSTRVALQLA